MLRAIICIVLSVVFILFFAPGLFANERLPVFVSIAPQRYFVQQIGKELIEHARQKNIRVIFVQPWFSAKNAELVAREIGGPVAFADPLAEDWMANLREVAAKFRAALR
jgi:ABC-type Zn uptake system ZnuABC Zn-binding protein ZnuA